MAEVYNIVWFDEVDSTNSRLASCREILPSGSVFAALRQSAGRGQRGNGWSAAAGENLTFSLLCRMERLPSRSQFSISRATALALTDYLASKGIRAMIKWPNDIYVGDRKICGILIENSIIGGSISSSIIGIGLNVNQTQFDGLPNPVSMSLLTGVRYDLKAEIETLLHHLGARLADVCRPDLLERDYDALLYRKGVWKDYLDCRNLAAASLTATTSPVEGGRTIRGCIEGVSPEGMLLLRTGNGLPECFAFKEIRYL